MSEKIESRLLRLSAEGTQGEWYAGEKDNHGFLWDAVFDADGNLVAFVNRGPADAVLIATSRNSIEALCRVVEAAREMDAILFLSEEEYADDDPARVLHAAIVALDEKGGAA